MPVRTLLHIVVGQRSAGGRLCRAKLFLHRASGTALQVLHGSGVCEREMSRIGMLQFAASGLSGLMLFQNSDAADHSL
jgi:hypothetical protein